MTPQFKNKNLFSLCVFFFFALFFPLFANAQSTQDAINQQDWISRQQQNVIEEQKRDREFETIEKERKRKKKAQEQNQNDKTIPVSGKPSECYAIKTINLIASNSLSKNQQKKLTEPFLGKCIEAKTLTQIITAIQTFYNDIGLVTARVVVPKQNIQTGNLELNIIEGKINEIIIGDNNLRDKMQAFTAFGNLEGNVLNLQDLNQGVYQMNRLPSNNAALKIEPAIEEGEANIYIANQKKFPARLQIGHDSLGNDFTGVNRTNFSGGIDNLLSLNDAINLNYSTNLNDDSQKKEIKSFTSSISIPFGYNTLSYDFSHSEFKGTSSGIAGKSTFTGFSQRSSATFDRVIFYKGNLRISNSLSLTTKSSASYLNNLKQTNSNRKLTIASLSFSLSNYFKNGVSLYVKPSYFKGLKILNAKKDDDNIDKEEAKAQFDYFKLYASVSKKLTIPKIEIPFTYTTEMDSQYSKDTLFGTEQFSVGGYYSVRGFRENYITGDSGYYFRNKANFNLGTFAKSFSQLNQFSLEPFYDYGYVKNKYSRNGADGRLSGAGIKTIYKGKYFDASLTSSWGTGNSRLVTSNKKENKLIYFEISANCC